MEYINPNRITRENHGSSIGYNIYDYMPRNKFSPCSMNDLEPIGFCCSVDTKLPREDHIALLFSHIGDGVEFWAHMSYESLMEIGFIDMEKFLACVTTFSIYGPKCFSVVKRDHVIAELSKFEPNNKDVTC